MNQSVKIGRKTVPIRERERHAKYRGLFNVLPSGRWRISLFGVRGRLKWSTLWHEMLHALSQDAADGDGVRELSERQVLAIEARFGALCRQNPNLMRRLVAELSKKNV